MTGPARRAVYALPDGSLSDARRRKRRRGHAAALVVSVGCHVAVLLALFLVRAERRMVLEPAPIGVALVDGLSLTDSPKAAAAPEPTPAPEEPVAQKNIVRPTEAPLRRIETLAAGDDDVAQPGAVLSDAELAGAVSADAGPAGRTCDMARWLQTALRKSARAHEAVANAHRLGSAGGRPVLVWNGDWVRSSGEDGEGLAGVREAMMMEIAFAPAACRAETMNGVVLISLGDAPGAPRLALGTGAWRWNELLRPRGGASRASTW